MTTTVPRPTDRPRRPRPGLWRTSARDRVVHESWAGLHADRAQVTLSAMSETNEIYQTLDLSLRVGEILLSSGAGAADVAAQMLNVARACGLRGVSADVTFTQLAMSHQAHPD